MILAVRDALVVPIEPFTAVILLTNCAICVGGSSAMKVFTSLRADTEIRVPHAIFERFAVRLIFPDGTFLDAIAVTVGGFANGRLVGQTYIREEVVAS